MREWNFHGPKQVQFYYLTGVVKYDQSRTEQLALMYLSNFHNKVSYGDQYADNDDSLNMFLAVLHLLRADVHHMSVSTDAPDLPLIFSSHHLCLNLVNHHNVAHLNTNLYEQESTVGQDLLKYTVLSLKF